jgi:hypothetical protein
MEEFIKYAVEMGSVAMIHKYTSAMIYKIYLFIPSLIKIGSCIQMLIGGIHRHTHSMEIA